MKLISIVQQAVNGGLIPADIFCSVLFCFVLRGAVINRAGLLHCGESNELKMDAI